MKLSHLLVIALVIAIVAYMLYFVVGMSSTFPSLREYHFGASKISFEKKLAAKVSASYGWSLENTDTVSGEKGESCYWASLTYQKNGQHLKYDIKYCVDEDSSNNDGKCLSLYVVGAFDYVEKSGGYKSSDKDVGGLLQTLDRALLTELAPVCDER